MDLEGPLHISELNSAIAFFSVFLIFLLISSVDSFRLLISHGSFLGGIDLREKI